MTKQEDMRIKDVELMMANPFYCLPTIDPIFVQSHEPLISEETFIKVGVKLIAEIGAEKYLRRLLDNLKGEYV